MQRKNNDRVAYTVAEFASLFGRRRGWAYRLIEEGKIHVVTGYGHKMIPAAEVSRILQSEGGAR
jgi:hypothetical protein